MLVDRIWPRGIRKDDPRVGQWLKEVAPSTELRKWYGHDPEKFSKFADRYRQELQEGATGAAFAELKSMAAAGEVTLVTATKDIERSQVAVLLDALRE